MKRYIKPEVEILRAETYAVILTNSITKEEEEQVYDFLSKGQFDDDDSANDWPSYSAWDE